MVAAETAAPAHVGGIGGGTQAATALPKQEVIEEYPPPPCTVHTPVAMGMAAVAVPLQSVDV